jgi:signal transduction histidine kinase
VVAGQLAPATVDGDPEALARALMNLVENGLVHGPAGGTVTVAVAVAGQTDDGAGGDAGVGAGAVVRVSVSDQGSGPDPDRRDQLFERFWRGPEAAGRPGAGLGLSIVAAIARAHGGSVQVDESTFTLTLPVADE